MQKKVVRHSTKHSLQSLNISLCSQAKDVFYHNYVVGRSKPLSFLEPFYSSTSEDEHLTRTVDAVSLAYLNYQRHSPLAQEEARIQYITALRLTGAALRTRDLVKKDSTFLAILLLDLYEKITSKEPQYDGAWAAHLNGALTLVKLRGKQQFTDPSGLRMLVRLSMNLLISCVASDRPVPSEVVSLRAKIAAHFAKPLDPKWKESDLMVEFAKLKHDINEGTLSGEEATTSLVDLDARFLALSVEVTPTWQYKTVRVDEKSIHHYELYHHLYPDELTMQTWNVLRLTRILLNELICSSCLDAQGEVKHDPDSLASYGHSRKTVEQMASEICASIPQYIADSFGSFPNPATISASVPMTLDQDTRTSPPYQPSPSHHLPCYRLIYPLYIAAQSWLATSSLRSWAIKQLRFMSEYHVIENAATVANVLESGERRDPWLVYAMLGSYAFVC